MLGPDPKGMRSGVEGPAASCAHSNGSGNKNRSAPRECFSTQVTVHKTDANLGNLLKYDMAPVKSVSPRWSR